MALTDINSEDRLVQLTFAEHLEQVLGGRASMPTTWRLFKENVSFEGSSFQSIQFSRPRGHFQKTVDLRGRTYTSIEPREYWPELMDRLKPYDRQPFVHLEEVLRRAGHDRPARDVYYWKRRESRHIGLRTPLSWLFDQRI